MARVAWTAYSRQCVLATRGGGNMLKLVMALLPLLLWFSAAPVAAQDAGDRMIVAGERVGAVRAASTAAQLRKVYGANNVRAGKFSTGEGEFDGILLFPDTVQEVRLYYKDGTRRIDIIEIGRAGGPWRTAQGIRVGMTLAELERLNGAPIALQRTEAEGGGYVLAENAGLRLPAPSLQFQITGTLSDAETQQLNARNKVMSSDPLLRKSAPTVMKIFVRLSRP